jgi:hypothetical protein
MERDKFKLPPSLKGVVFRGDEFFEKKKQSPRGDFLLENLSHVEKLETPRGPVLHRKISIKPNAEPTPEGYVFPGTANLRDMNPELLSLLTGQPEGTITDSSRILFLDLETTGLAGGTGTYAFLCGIGYFENDSFVIEQFFMEDYPFEQAMLELLSTRIAEAEAFVTFNGKTFDIPLLSTRFIFNRIPLDLDIPHIDLLHPSRRIWKGVLSDCRLDTIEKEYFRLKRERDVDGSLIPQIYFNYLRGIHQDWMLPVFDHNVQDIATLGGLLLFFCRILSDPKPAELSQSPEIWGLGRLFLKFGRVEEALISLEHALFLSREPDLEEMLLIHLGKLYKKLGRHQEALQTWEQLMNVSQAHKISAAVEMAKYYEHRAREPVKAREIIIRILSEFRVSEELEIYISGMEAGAPPEITPDLEKRLHRLEAKIQKQKKSILPDEDIP